MKFHALLPVRDEADIIYQCLECLAQWADFIYVFDTGSIDNTWEIVQDFATHHKQVRPIKKDAVYFSDTRLRGYLFNIVRQEMQDGDWFLRVDADEFHHISPPEFVKTRLCKHETIVYHQYYDFQLTASEVKAWKSSRETIADRQRPIEDRRRWFIPSFYSEPRLCRYRTTMKWPPTVSFPYNAGYVAKTRLPIRHYPHRDPVQLAHRYCLRSIMLADATNRANWQRPEQHHWSQEDWRQFITPDDAPNLQYWNLDSPLPEFHFENHLAKPHKRLLQRLVHSSFFLPLLDRIRPSFPENGYPQKIQVEVNELLAKVLSTENFQG